MDQHLLTPTQERNNQEFLSQNDNKESALKENNEVDATEITPLHFKEQDSPLSCTSKEEKKPTLFVYLLTFFAALGGFLFGYDTGVISGAMLPLKVVFQLDSLWQELIVSVTVAGAIFGAILGGGLSDVFGRRPVLLSAASIFTLGSLLLGVAFHKELLLLGRLVVGVGIGLASMTVPVYIAEAAPAGLRGALVTINQLFVTFGQFCASVIDGIFSTNAMHGWRYMLGLAGIPSIIMLVGFLFMPESPRWLVKRGKLSKSKTVLIKLRGTKDIEEEYEGIVSRCKEDIFQKPRMSPLRVFQTAMKTYYTRRALIVGCGLQAIQQLSGINTVMYYSATIIAMAGVQDQSQAIWLAAAVSFCNFLFSFLSLWLIEKIGRRKLALGSLGGVILGLLIMAAMFYVMKLKSPKVGSTLTDDICSQYKNCFDCVNNNKCGFCFEDIGSLANSTGNVCLAVNVRNKHGRPFLCQSNTNISRDWVVSGCPSSYAWLAPAAMIFYLAMFSSGMGPIPWTVNAEIYPLWARSVGNACSTTTNWLFNLLISLTFLHLMEYLSRSGAFLLYTCIAIGSWIFLFLLLPETEKHTLEEVEDIFKGSLFIPCKKDTKRSLLVD